MLFTKHRINKLSSSLTFVCILWSNIAIASDDAYLDAMEAEAESSSNVQQAGQNNKKTEQKKSTKDRQKLEFEARLSNELPATFKTYRMLSKENKQIVISTYFDSNRSMPKSTRILFDLYFKKK